MTRGAVYHHFDSKQGLFTAVLAATHDTVSRAVAAAADRARAVSGDPWEGFEAGCRAFLESSSRPEVPRMLVDGPAVVGWTSWRAHDAAASGHHLDEALGELARMDLLAAVSVPVTGALLSGAMNEAVLWVDSHRSEDHEHALAEAWSSLRLMLSALRNPA